MNVRVRRGLHPRRGARRGQPWRTLDERTRKVDGVRAVENLTHLPGEPAPAKDETRSGAHMGGTATSAPPRSAGGHVRAPPSKRRTSFASSRRARAPSTASTCAWSPARCTASSGRTAPGKSTTVHMLTTLLPPTAGRAWVAGHDVVEDGAAVRATIGAALQEAALDPFLTGREHMQAPDRPARHDRARRRASARTQLLERVGLVQAADRRVGGYSGGMKRRLDLALALVHRPAHPVPRRAHHRPRRAEPQRPLGGGAAARGRPRRDRLPHHPVPGGGRRARGPRRDHRPRAHRRRGHARGAEGRDRPPERRGDPAGPGRARPHEGGARPASESPWPARPRARPCGWRAATPSSRRWCGRSTPRTSRSRSSSCTRPRSTTSSSRRPAARSRARRTPSPSGARAGVRQVLLLATALGGAHAAPAGDGVPVDLLPAAPALDQQQRPRTAPRACPASRPTPTSSSRSRSRSSRARSSPPMSAGTNVANDIETRLPEPALAHAAAAGGADAGPAHRHPGARADPGAHVPAGRASCSATASPPGPAACRC